jgi:hypothetical protein
MSDPSKVLDSILGPWTHIFAAVACVALVWLLLRDLGVGMSVSKDGMNTSFDRWAVANLATPYAHFAM